MINDGFWKGKKILITGHSGFKGSWMCLVLYTLGAEVLGYSLNPPTEPSLYNICRINELVKSVTADIRDLNTLTSTVNTFQPDIIIHMAAQPLVRESYKNPLETYEINVMGTVNLFEAIRKCKSVKSVVIVTTDKCYDNKEWYWGYRENEPLGGYDPYSNSKACAELVTAAYRNCFFNFDKYNTHGVAIASARAGNVIGGGDWAADRLIPDSIAALMKNEVIHIRSPKAVRPWQHVLEPLSGYLTLARKLFEEGTPYAEGWNFGPDDNDAKSVEWIVKKVCEMWESGASYTLDQGNHPHEANYLRLDCSKAKSLLGWYPKWNLDYALRKVIEWTKDYKAGNDPRETCFKQISEYMNR